MIAFDIELIGFDGPPPTNAELAAVLGVDVETLQQSLVTAPAMIARMLSEERSEQLFHELRALGAQVQLHRVASVLPPPSQAPAFDPGQLPMPTFDEPAPPSGSMHPGPAGPGSRQSVQPGGDKEPVATASASQWPASGSISPPGQRALEDKGSFVRALVQAYLYPVQKRALPILGGVSLVTLLLEYIPIFGFLLGLGVWTAYLFAVLRRSAGGHADLPIGGEFQSASDFLGPMFRGWLALFVPLLLLMLLSALVAGGVGAMGQALTGSGGSMMGAPIFSLVILGAWFVYLPASLILAAYSTGCLGGLNIIAGVRLIAREPKGYFTAMAGAFPALCLFFLFHAMGQEVVEMASIKFLPELLVGMLTLLPALVIARVFGLFMWHFEDELNVA